MKTFKKIFLGLFILVTVFALFAINTKNVKAESLVTHDQLKVEGAGVRTTGKAGIRFVGSVGSFDTTNVTAYGICIAYGETDANDNFVKGETINDKVVLYGEDTALDKDGHYYVVLYNIPEEAYAQNVTARAYVIINGTAIAYGAEVKVRSLASTVVNAVDDEQTGDLIDTVYAKIDRISVTANDYNIIKNNKPTKFVNTSVTGKSLVMFEKPSATAEELIFAKGADVYATLKGAVEGASNNDIIYTFAGTYSGEIALSASNVKIYGPNYNVLASASRTSEAYFCGILTVMNQANNLEIDGLKFIDEVLIDAEKCTASGSITYAFEGFTLKNCVIDKGTNTSSFISFDTGDKVYAKDINIVGCSFAGNNIAFPMISIVNNENTTIDSCEFDNILHHVFYVKDSSNGYGLIGNLVVTNSRFTNITKSAIWINYADPCRKGSTNDYKFIISDCYFESVNGDAAIDIEDSAQRVYGQGYLMTRNTFKDVYGIVWTRCLKGLVFTKNIVYFDDNTAGYIVTGYNISGSEINCAGNLYYTTDGSEIITDPYTVRPKAFNGASSATANTDNYATYEAYLAALEN